MYPKLGPGPDVGIRGRDRAAKGGCVMTGLERREDSCRRQAHHGRWKRCTCETGERRTFAADYFFSTMPVKELMRFPRCAGSGERARGQRRPHVPRLHHRRPAAEAAAGPRDSAARIEAAHRQLDLHPGARRAGRPAADLQQLEPVHGGRSRTRSGSASNISATKPTISGRCPTPR